MNDNPGETRITESNRRNFLKRFTSGVIGGSLLAGVSQMKGQEKKGSSKSPVPANGPLSITDFSPLIGQIGMFGFNFPPAGWLQCNGQVLQIADYTDLFQVVGTIYGGNGVTTFGLPNLQGVVPIGIGTGPSLSPRTLGETGGAQNVSLSNTNIPSHTHGLSASSGNGTSSNPQGNFFAVNAEGMGQFNSSSDTNLNTGTLSGAGGELAHNNMPPYLVLNFCIAYQGNFPSRTTADPDQVYGDVLLFAGNFVPAGYLTCDGSLLDIGTNDVLFNLIGTTFGGDGQFTFAVPDLRGRAPIHSGPLFPYIGEIGGSETVTLTISQIPSHNHQMSANSGIGDSADPGNNYVAANLEGVQQFSETANGLMNSGTIGSDGGSTPHENMPPFLAMTYCISNSGIFPSQ